LLHARRRFKQWLQGEGVWEGLRRLQEAPSAGLWSLSLRSLHRLNSPFTLSGTTDAPLAPRQPVAELKVKIP